MLSGERPFRGETTAEVMTAILKQDSPELATPDVPPGLERVVRRCLEKRPEERFQSARDIGFALEAASGRGDRKTRACSDRRGALAAGTVIGGLGAWRLSGSSALEPAAGRGAVQLVASAGMGWTPRPSSPR
jgi:hypothetical protein